MATSTRRSMDASPYKCGLAATEAELDAVIARVHHESGHPGVQRTVYFVKRVHPGVTRRQVSIRLCRQSQNKRRTKYFCRQGIQRSTEAKIPSKKLNSSCASKNTNGFQALKSPMVNSHWSGPLTPAGGTAWRERSFTDIIDRLS